MVAQVSTEFCQIALNARHLCLYAMMPQGDPSAVPYAVENVRAVIGKKPVFGICMGHQLLGQAFGGSTFKLKFGHHGGNHPIRFEETSKPLYFNASLQSLGFRVHRQQLNEVPDLLARLCIPTESRRLRHGLECGAQDQMAEQHRNAWAV